MIQTTFSLMIIYRKSILNNKNIWKYNVNIDCTISQMKSNDEI
jgi:hypothetical protein